MEPQTMYCNRCSQFTDTPDDICASCRSNDRSLQFLDSNLMLLSERVANLVHTLQDLTIRMNSVRLKNIPASEDTIDVLPWVEASFSDCPICFETTTQYSRAMPCGHIYHNECLVKWLRIQNSCPICRYKLEVVE